MIYVTDPRDLLDTTWEAASAAAEEHNNREDNSFIQPVELQINIIYTFSDSDSDLNRVPIRL